MKKILLVFVMILVVFSAPAFQLTVNAGERSISDDFFQEYIDFSVETFQSFNNGSNMLYSPVSLYYVLAMMEVMSSGDALTELDTLLGTNEASILEQIPLMTNDMFVDSSDAEYWFANSLFYDDVNRIDSQIPMFNLDTLNQYQSYFSYDLQNLNFVDGTAAQVLADKISEGTNGFLEISPSDLAFLSQSNILFNNTIYYKGQWQKSFDKSDNFEGDFHLDDETAVIVEYMKKTDPDSYLYSSDFASAAKTFFKDGSSMIYILPTVGSSITDLLANPSELSTILSEQNRFVHRSLLLTLPKLEMAAKVLLKTKLQTLGLTEIFNVQTDNFPDLSDYPLGIAEIVQSSKIIIDEEGVTVASSTLSIGCAAPAPPYEFTVNQPYIYVIMSPGNIPIFIGIVYSV